MKKIIAIYKPVGKTPLEMVNHFKKKYSQYAAEKISYAGRLDPMAEGVLILLIGEENKKRDIFEGLAKTYEAEIVFGVVTDSYDTLGIIEKVDKEKLIDKDKIEGVLKNFRGKSFQKFPPYSSKTVRGKPLYWWARNNKLSKIKIPKKQINILKIELLEVSVIHGIGLAQQALRRAKIVAGEFRQQEVENSWTTFLKEHAGDDFAVARIMVECSSGTYIRQLAFDIGGALRTGGFALSIIRTKVGKYILPECLKM